MNKTYAPIGEIRQTRYCIPKEFGHDLKRYIAYLESLRRDYPEQTRLRGIIRQA